MSKVKLAETGQVEVKLAETGQFKVQEGQRVLIEYPCTWAEKIDGKVIVSGFNDEWLFECESDDTETLRLCYKAFVRGFERGGTIRLYEHDQG